MTNHNTITLMRITLPLGTRVISRYMVSTYLPKRITLRDDFGLPYQVDHNAVFTQPVATTTSNYVGELDTVCCYLNENSDVTVPEALSHTAAIHCRAMTL